MEPIQAVLAAVWFANGLLAKVLRLVPRHERIVARFFGDGAAPVLTRLIGAGEVFMAAWIFSGREKAACFAAQAFLIVAMNFLELWKARDLLLYPRLMPAANAVLLSAALRWSRGG